MTVPSVREHRLHDLRNQRLSINRQRRSRPPPNIPLSPHSRVDELTRLSRRIEQQRLDIENYRDRIDHIKADAEHSTQVKRRLKEELSSAQRTFSKVTADLESRSETQKHQVQKLESTVTALNGLIDEQNVVIELARNIFMKNIDKIRGLTIENERLQDKAQKSNIRADMLEERINQTDTGVMSEMTSWALEVQAERTLRMLHGLEADIAERDATIEMLQAINIPPN